MNSPSSTSWSSVNNSTMFGLLRSSFVTSSAGCCCCWWWWLLRNFCCTLRRGSNVLSRCMNASWSKAWAAYQDNTVSHQQHRSNCPRPPLLVGAIKRRGRCDIKISLRISTCVGCVRQINSRRRTVRRGRGPDTSPAWGITNCDLLSSTKGWGLCCVCVCCKSWDEECYVVPQWVNSISVWRTEQEWTSSRGSAKDRVMRIAAGGTVLPHGEAKINVSVSIHIQVNGLPVSLVLLLLLLP